MRRARCRLTVARLFVVMARVSQTMDSPQPSPIHVALCVDATAYNRFGDILRHLLVGLVDQAVPLRLLSSDPRVETLTVGPFQTLLHQRPTWPFAKRRIDHLLDALSLQPPTTVHALSMESYRVAGAIAEAFDADLVLAITSLADCDALGDLGTTRVGRFVAMSAPLVTVLEDQMKIDASRIELIRPGIIAAQCSGSFSRPERIPSILCLSDFETGGAVDTLIEAADIVRNQGGNFMLFLLGAGRREAAYRRLIRERNLAAVVTLSHPKGDLSQALDGADMFVRPSADTAFHAGTLQAMAAGVAVVSSPNVVSDHLRDGETAIVCDKPTAGALAEGIARLLGEPIFAQRIATAGQEYIRANHPASGMAERVAQTYRTLALARTTFSLKE